MAFHDTLYLLELRQYKNGFVSVKCMFILKLLPFFPCRVGFTETSPFLYFLSFRSYILCTPVEQRRGKTRQTRKINRKNDKLSWLHLKKISGQIAAALRATCALQFWPTWPAAFDWPLLLDERSLRSKLWQFTKKGNKYKIVQYKHKHLKQ